MFESEPIGARSAAVDVPIGPNAAAAGRRMMSDLLRRWGVADQELRDVAQLVVSELVTNAVVHGAGRVRLEADLSDGRLRIAVCDGSSVLPAARRPAPRDTSGRGLRIVEALALCWGAEDTGSAGKRVWADLAAEPRLGARRLTAARA